MRFSNKATSQLLTVLAQVAALCLLFFGPVISSQASEAADDSLYTIYLVRHAEKQADGSKDPALTACGIQRATALASIFRGVNFAALYSSDYQRTLDTAQPTATDQQLDIVRYAPDKLENFAQTLKALKRDSLVVGHSNTTAVLAGLLAGQTLAAFDESIYDRIYQVVISGQSSRIHVLHQAFSCN